MKNKLLSMFQIVLLLLLFIHSRAQDSSRRNKEYLYRFTVGGGFGNFYPGEDGDIPIGIGGTCEFALQSKNSVYALGIHRIEEFDIFVARLPINSINSFDITFGKVLTHGIFFSSLSAGIGFIDGTTRGKFLAYGPGFLSADYYEKIKIHSIGIPISAKIFCVPLKFYAPIGLELYLNINPNNTFYAINVCFQIGKLQPKGFQLSKRNSKKFKSKKDKIIL